jgi:putative FmdB family regulatory protein
MPIYSYKCKRCKDEFDLLVSLSEDANAPRCPRCGCDDLEKKISLFGLGGGSEGESGCPVPS